MKWNSRNKFAVHYLFFAATLWTQTASLSRGKFCGTARKDTQSNLPNALFRSKDYLLTSKSFIQRQLSSGGIKSHLWRCSDQLSSFSYYFQLILFLYQFDKNIILSQIHYTNSMNINWLYWLGNQSQQHTWNDKYDIGLSMENVQSLMWKRFEMNCNLLSDPRFTVNIIQQ